MNEPHDSSQQPQTVAAAHLAALLIRPQDFVTLPGPEGAPFVRKQCFDDGHVWVGEVTTEPGSASPWHHHGDYDTFAYCLEGEGRLELVDPSLEPVDFRADGSLAMIPKGLVHREVNTGSVRNRFLIVRVGSGQPVFPADGPPAA